jgi:hypothetical protein
MTTQTSLGEKRFFAGNVDQLACTIVEYLLVGLGENKLSYHAMFSQTDGAWGWTAVELSHEYLIRNFHHFVQFKVANRRYTNDLAAPATTSLKHLTNKVVENWVKAPTSARTLIVFRYGDAVRNASDFSAFKKSVLLPSVTDSSGAAAEVVVRALMGRLTDEWGQVFGDAPSILFRLWASHIAKMPTIQHDVEIQKMPPANISALFARVCPDSETRRERRVALALKKDIIDASLSQLDNMRIRIETGMDSINALMKTIDDTFRALLADVDGRIVAYNTLSATNDAFMRSYMPPRTNVSIDAVEDAEDVDHEYEVNVTGVDDGGESDAMEE